MIDYSNLCHNSGILKALYLIKKIVSLSFSIVPAILIISITIYMVKQLLNESNIDEKKVMFSCIKKILWTSMLFFVPLLTRVIFTSIGSINTNFFTCYNEATKENIEKYEKEETEILRKAKEEEEAKRKEKLKENEEKNKAKKAQQKKESASDELKSGAAKINQKAIELAWPVNTSSSKYAYPSGNPTSAFKKAYNNYPKRDKGCSKDYGCAPYKGASCDRFVGTVVYASGYDKSFPSGLKSQWTHLASSSKWRDMQYHYDTSILKPGDIVLYKKKSNTGDGHILIIVKVNGKLGIAEAALDKSYGHIVSSISRLARSNSDSFSSTPKVYRAKK